MLQGNSLKTTVYCICSLDILQHSSVITGSQTFALTAVPSCLTQNLTIVFGHDALFSRQHILLHQKKVSSGLATHSRADGPAASAWPGAGEKFRFLGPAPGLQNQNQHFNNIPGRSNAHSGFRSVVLGNSRNYTTYLEKHCHEAKSWISISFLITWETSEDHGMNGWVWA